jgi:hypothetical protein
MSTSFSGRPSLEAQQRKPGLLSGYTTPDIKIRTSQRKIIRKVTTRKKKRTEIRIK